VTDEDTRFETVFKSQPAQILASNCRTLLHSKTNIWPVSRQVFNFVFLVREYSIDDWDYL